MLKIAVYAIAKNEGGMAREWAASCAEADLRLVVDTGSRDETVALLRESGVEVMQREFHPWRFDVARNFALDAVPMDYDVCVSLDLDERLSPGWRQALEAAWQGDVTRLRYFDVREWNEFGEPKRMVHGFKIHARQGYRWKYAIHEVLVTDGRDVERFVPELMVLQQPSPKANSGQYLAMLEELVKREREESRYQYYLGHELLLAGRQREALDAYTSFLDQTRAERSWERSHALRAMAQAHRELKSEPGTGIRLLLRAAAESLNEREIWWELATLYSEFGDHLNAYACASIMANLTDPRQSPVLDPRAWAKSAQELKARLEETLRVRGTSPSESLEASEASWRSRLGVVERGLIDSSHSPCGDWETAAFRAYQARDLRLALEQATRALAIGEASDAASRSRMFLLLAVANLELGHPLSECAPLCWSGAAEDSASVLAWLALSATTARLGAWPIALAAAVNAIDLASGSESELLKEAWSLALEGSARVGWSESDLLSVLHAERNSRARWLRTTDPADSR